MRILDDWRSSRSLNAIEGKTLFATWWLRILEGWRSWRSLYMRLETMERLRNTHGHCLLLDDWASWRIDLAEVWTGLEDRRSWRNTWSWENWRWRQWPLDGWSIFCTPYMFAKKEVELATWNCIDCSEIYGKVLTWDFIDWKEWIKARESVYEFWRKTWSGGAAGQRQRERSWGEKILQLHFEAEKEGIGSSE